MIKREELTNPKRCMSRAQDEEMTFVLLGRDAAAPVAIRAWVKERIRLGKNKPADVQIVEAMVQAEAWEGPIFSAPAEPDSNWKDLYLRTQDFLYAIREEFGISPYKTNAIDHCIVIRKWLRERAASAPPEPAPGDMKEKAE